MDTTTKNLKAEQTRCELLLRVREGDRIEVLFAANYEAQSGTTTFIAALAAQVALYESDYDRWAHEQMCRYNEIEDNEALSSEAIPAER